MAKLWGVVVDEGLKDWKLINIIVGVRLLQTWDATDRGLTFQFFWWPSRVSWADPDSSWAECSRTCYPGFWKAWMWTRVRSSASPRKDMIEGQVWGAERSLWGFGKSMEFWSEISYGIGCWCWRSVSDMISLWTEAYGKILWFLNIILNLWSIIALKPSLLFILPSQSNQQEEVMAYVNEDYECLQWKFNNFKSIL